MKADEKIQQLRNLIEERLRPLIKGDAALFGLPMHGNTGDTYIALGELEFLKAAGVRVIYEKMLIDSTPLPELPTDCTILLQGGGDFGDVWRGIQEFRLKVIDKYKKHHIVVFPQTVFYSDTDLCRQDAKLLGTCSDLTLCARDKTSYEYLNRHFNARILLVPDMAFFISPRLLRKHCHTKVKKENLYLKRTDKELGTAQKREADAVISNGEKTYISDWPTIDNKLRCLRLSLRLVGLTDAFVLRRMFKVAGMMRRITLWHLHYAVYPAVAKAGVRFLSSYRHIYVTRMHAAILAVLLGKDFALADNSYHKNRHFFETWLSDVEGARLQDTGSSIKNGQIQTQEK